MVDIQREKSSKRLHSDDQLDDISLLNQNFCKNFMCCGLSLASMHELLEHYESSHVKHELEESSEYQRNNFKRQGLKRFKYNPTLDLRNLDVMPSCNNDSSAFESAIYRVNYRGPLTASPYSNDLKDAEFYESSLITVVPASLSAPSEDELIFTDLDVHPTAKEYLKSLRLADGTKPKKAQDILESVGIHSKWRKHQCLVPGCGKVYKNANGLKYHSFHCHSIIERNVADAVGKAVREDPSLRPFKCTSVDCEKRYKNSNGLKYHMIHAHGEVDCSNNDANKQNNMF
jgi:hypothetical protein